MHRLSRRSIHGSLMLALLAIAMGAADVDHGDVKVQRKRFDPKRPPADMPALKPPEAAVTVSTFGIEASMRSQVVGEEQRGGKVISRVKVTDVKLKTTLEIVIWLPSKAEKYLVDHEDGHRVISERFYGDSEQLARDLAKGLDGKVLRGEGRDSEAASRAAMDAAIGELTTAYMERTKDASSRVQDLYDEITDHGRNTRITVEAAIDRAFQKWREEQRDRQRDKPRDKPREAGVR